MPIHNFPFVPLGGILRPWLPIKIINPHTQLFSYTYGLVDTGADECCVPDSIAQSLGHNITNGRYKEIGGVGSRAVAYSHTTKIEIYDGRSAKLVYTIDETCIDCVVGCTVVLLGVKQFLDNFKLNVDYPQKTFSITYP
jgi:predicted aspartyl protease